MNSGGNSDTEQLRRELERLGPGDDDLGLSVAFLRSILAHMPALCVVITPEGRFLYVNRTIPGLTEQDVLGKTVFDFMPEEVHAEARESFARVTETGQPDSYVGFGQGEMGPRSRYQNWIGPILSGKRVIALTLITRDVSVAWEVQRSLADREQRLSIALEAAGMGMWRWDAKSRITELDHRAQAIYGLEDGQVEPDGMDPFIHDEDRERVKAAARSCMADGRSYHLANRIVRADGQLRWVFGHGIPLREEDGTLQGMLGTLVDVTEQRELEEQLRQSQKLDAVGQLTAGIAHNFNNMLASIIPTLEIAGGEVSEETKPLVEAASEAARRAAQMVRELMTFAGKNRPSARRTVRVGELLASTLSICRTTFDRSIEIDSEPPSEDLFADVDAGQIEAALLNVLINARDALVGSGVESPRVTIRVSVADRPPEPVEASSAMRWMKIVISDNGPGMSSDVRSRIFEPFFTTKDVDKGTGLGLSTTYAIVREHGGTVRCDSSPGNGTTVALLLPQSARKADAAAPPAPPSPRPAEGRILIVDDEELVRRVVRRVLADAGFSVQTAADGDAALEVLRDWDVDAMLLDLNMPGQNWPSLLERLRSDFPAVRVVAFTGQSVDLSAGDFDGVLSKPAKNSTLVETIREILARPGRLA